METALSDWKHLGACVGKDRDLFFPDSSRWGEVRAKAICESCDVRAQCMDYAIEFNEVGIWGGTTERERKRIKNRYIRPNQTRKALDLLSQG